MDKLRYWMNNRGVWRKIKRHQMPQGRRCVKHKWVFKIKRNGVFRARLVACGYSQIPGMDYTENQVYSPVIHDTTFRLLHRESSILSCNS